MEVKYLKGVGPKRAEAFSKIGIEKIEDFLKFIPRTYVAKVVTGNLEKFLGEPVIILGKVIDVQKASSPSRPTLVFLSDGSGLVEIPIFGASEFRAKMFVLNDVYLFYGKVAYGWKGTNFALEYRDHLKVNLNDELDKSFLTYNIFPIYELAGVLKKTWIKPLLLSKIVFNALRAIILNNKNPIPETLSEEIIKETGLPSKKDAILRINFPKKFEDIEIARKRLSFDELFFLELIMALRKRSIKNEEKGISFKTEITALRDDFLKCFDFELTQAQKKVINEIYTDMKSDNVMNRLLQGDVGSGKTIVSIFAMLVAVENGYQAALMCPTELLAEQHFLTVNNFLKRLNEVSGKNLKVVLLVGGQKKKLREEIYQDIRLGRANIIVGTHALFQEKTEYKNLGFAIIDEQHKFGVMQRARLKEKGFNPDVLVMTATPIPRTLSLTVYGDLDVSIIDELPINRKQIKTFLNEEPGRGKVYEFIKKEISNGRQVYVVFPLIDESEKLDLKSAEEGFINLRDNIFKDFKVGMIHGRLFWYEKDEVMNEFKDKKIDILVSTTVIEVGIDIPNATIMMIEESQRFGLSQLHQLRGRVGRGSEQSYCFLMAKNLDEVSKKRLDVMCKSTNGFEIAEKDMEIRGPGEFFGVRQSGVLNFSATDLTKDKDILIKARDFAFDIINDDPHLRENKNKEIREHFFANYKDSLYLMKIA